MITMRRNAWSLAVIPFVLAACGGAPDTDDPDLSAETATEEAPPPPATPTTFMATVTPVGESGTTGEVEIRAVGEATEVRVMLNGAAEGVLQGHIHTGTCATPGSVVIPLDAITAPASGTGESMTRVDIPIMTVMNGDHIVQYHAAGGEPGPAVACAAIPTHSM